MKSIPFIATAPQALSLQTCGEVWVPMPIPRWAMKGEVPEVGADGKPYIVAERSGCQGEILPPFAPGDTLLVKEPWGLAGARLVDPCLNYRADGAQIPIHSRGLTMIKGTTFGVVHWDCPGGIATSPQLMEVPDGWRPASQMPPWAVRTRRPVLSVEPRLLAGMTAEQRALWPKCKGEWGWRVGLVGV